MSEPIKWKLMPFPPTREMISKAFQQQVFDPPVGPIHNHHRVLESIYTAMWIAVPEPEGDTPETDAMIDSCGDYEKWHSYRDRLHAFAKKLERERNILLAKLKEKS
jgi:hypothetical protein